MNLNTEADRGSKMLHFRFYCMSCYVILENILFKTISPLFVYMSPCKAPQTVSKSPLKYLALDGKSLLNWHITKNYFGGKRNYKTKINRFQKNRISTHSTISTIK